jgi:hypothetical protein
LVLGVQPTLLPESRPAAFSASQRKVLRAGDDQAGLLRGAALLVTLPVFVQAPLVHAQPLLAAVLTVPLLAAGIVLGLSERPQRARWGALLVGFAGSWLCGSLFWGWCRLHPVWHLPLEALALPLALGGLRSRWRWAGAFYLASLLGTAATDAAMALTGVMHLWPMVLAAPPAAAMQLLQEAARQVLSPFNLGVIGFVAAALGGIGAWLWQQQSAGRVAAITVLTTLGVDGIFLVLALGAPRWSGLI